MTTDNVSREDCQERVREIETLVGQVTKDLAKKIEDGNKTLHQRLDIISAHQAGQAVDIAIIKTKVDERTSKAPHAISGGIACIAAVVIVWLKGKLGLE